MTAARSDLMALADQATLIVYNCTGKIEHQWQRRLVEKINKAVRDAALSAPVGEPVARGGAVTDWWAESIKLYRQNKSLRKALQEQHDWHLAQGEKDFGEGVTLNMADEYSDSGMCERTTAALDAVLPSGIEGYEKWKEQTAHPPAPAVGPEVREKTIRAIMERLSGCSFPLRVGAWHEETASLIFDQVAAALTRPLGGFVQGSIADCGQSNEQSGKQPSLKTSPELLAALERAKAHVMTPAERYEQRRSFTRGMCPSNRDYAEWCAEVDKLLPPLPAVAETDADAQRDDGLLSGGGA